MHDFSDAGSLASCHPSSFALTGCPKYDRDLLGLFSASNVACIHGLAKEMCMA